MDRLVSKSAQVLARPGTYDSRIRHVVLMLEALLC